MRFGKLSKANSVVLMRELSLQTWCCTKEMERPDNIFFKEQQSQTRKRARKAPNDGSGCVVCFAFITTNLRCSQRHYYFFLETKMATRNDDGRAGFETKQHRVADKIHETIQMQKIGEQTYHSHYQSGKGGNFNPVLRVTVGHGS